MTKDFWQDMREEGFILIDAPARKFAVFPNDSGQVVIASYFDGETHINVMEPDEIGTVISDLRKAQATAQKTWNAIEPEYQAHLAISKAMGVK